MLKTLLLLIVCVPLALSSLTVQAQKSRISKLVIAKGETYTVGPDNILLVDTLIMQDKATIVFAPEMQGILQAHVAIIGDKCTVSSKGKDGASTQVGIAPKRQEVRRNLANTSTTLLNGEVINADPVDNGTRGQDGGNLKLSLHFEKLGSLIIDSRGGRGGNGTNGKNGKKGTPDRHEERKVRGANGQYVTEVFVIPGNKGTDGSDATAGIAGGNGGNIDFTYSTSNFIPVFNQTRTRHGISLLHSAGETGRDGLPGKGGFSSVDGRLVHQRLAASRDGEIKLTNANALSVQD
ncbi:hypothetical protein K3G39_18165 [Pontibacter sp. HSC-14F20]|uniref:hypothetical protein n=1 Tax=Pontibacter sp. HSC-14F20 TaxID=2864136 RepID=UPI001C731F00|nr:hypothetical protein [Pontibacter sp. HSC-14F20]MBX0335164.1 hypothetical protein [Pontibacter sp. HSC-14F20]